MQTQTKVLHKTPFDYWLRKNGTIATSRISPLNGKTPAELLLMAETRQLLQLLVDNQEALVSEDLRATITALLRSRARRTAPFTPLSAEQRLGWLDEVTHLVCKAHFHAFTPGTPYRIKCEEVTVERLIKRKSLQGVLEDVLITGNELVATMQDDSGCHHAFCHTEIVADIHIHALHNLQAIVDHFIIPAAPDIAKVYPATYLKNTQFLSTL